jgi:TolB protein
MGRSVVAARLSKARWALAVLILAIVGVSGPASSVTPKRPIVASIDMRSVVGDKPSGLYAIDPATGKRRRLLAKAGRQPLWSPDGRKLVVARRFENRQELWIVPANGSGARRVTYNERLDQWPSWSADSTSLVVERFDVRDSSYDNELFIVSVDGGRALNLTRNRKDDRCPDWSPRSDSIAFVRGGDILKVRADGTSERRLTEARAYEYGPKWSPNGRAILFERDSRRGDYGDLFIMNRRGGKVQRVTDTVTDEYVYGWSPNGKAIVFVTSSNGRDFSLWIVRADGSRLRELVANVGSRYGGIEPNWSRSGKRIVYRRSEGERSDLWTIRPDGSHNRRLTKTNKAHESTPAWFSPPQGCRGLY